MKGDRIGEFEEVTLLAVRALGDGAYAVAVQQFIEKGTGRDVVMGAVYAALERLERKGLVTSAFGDATPARGGKAKRFFEITQAGVRTIKEIRRSRNAMWRLIEGPSR